MIMKSALFTDTFEDETTAVLFHDPNVNKTS